METDNHQRVRPYYQPHRITYKETGMARIEDVDTHTLGRQWDTVITAVIDGAEPRDLLMEYADYLAAELGYRNVSAVEILGRTEEPTK